MLKTTITAVATLFLFCGVALAQHMVHDDASFAQKPNWEISPFGNSVQNVQNNDIRFDWDGGQFATPGNANDAQQNNGTANDESSAIDGGSGSGGDLVNHPGF